MGTQFDHSCSCVVLRFSGWIHQHLTLIVPKIAGFKILYFISNFDSIGCYFLMEDVLYVLKSVWLLEVGLEDGNKQF